MIKSRFLHGLLVSFGVLATTALGLLLLYLDHHPMVLEESFELPKISYASPSPAAETVGAGDMYIDGRLDINKADQKALEALPGIGPALAERIIAFRQETPFKVVRDIKKVAGIGDKIFTTLEPYICVGR